MKKRKPARMKASYVRKPFVYIEDEDHPRLERFYKKDEGLDALVVATELQPWRTREFWRDNPRDASGQEYTDLEHMIRDGDKLIRVPSKKYAGWQRTVHAPGNVLELWE